MRRDIAFAIGVRHHNAKGPGPSGASSEEIHRQDKHLYPGNNELNSCVGAGRVIGSDPVSPVFAAQIDTGAVNRSAVACGEITGRELRSKVTPGRGRL